MEPLIRDLTIFSDEGGGFSMTASYRMLVCDMEVVADLFHASFVVMRQVDEDFTSL